MGRRSSFLVIGSPTLRWWQQMVISDGSRWGGYAWRGATMEERGTRVEAAVLASSSCMAEKKLGWQLLERGNQEGEQ